MFGVARIQKVQKSGIRGLEIHNRRLRTSRTNPDIDPARTHLNYTWIASKDHSKDVPLYSSVVGEKIDALNLKYKPRANAVLLLDVVISASPELFEKLDSSRTNSFFKAAIKAVKDFFGGIENLAYAHVHYDEKTPHAHFGIVPVFEGRLCAKKLLSPARLKAFQTFMHSNVFQHYGLDRGQPAAETNRKHKTTLEYKNGQLAKKIADMDKRLAEIEAREQAIAEREATLAEREHAADMLEVSIEAGEAALLRLDEDLGARLEKVRATIRACDRLQAYADKLHADNVESIEAEIMARPEHG